MSIALATKTSHCRNMPNSAAPRLSSNPRKFSAKGNQPPPLTNKAKNPVDWL